MRPIRISCLIVIINVMTIAFTAAAAHAVLINWTFDAVFNDSSTISAGKLTYDTTMNKVISAMIEYSGGGTFPARTFTDIIGSGINFVSIVDPADRPDLTNDPLFTVNSVDWTDPAIPFNIVILSCVDANCTRAGGGARPILNARNITGTTTQEPIPEPTTILLLSTGLLGLAGYRWHQRRREGTQVG